MLESEYEYERSDLMTIEDRFFDQQWIQELSNEDFRMLMYLMHFATKKCGIVELNMRMLNFAANTGRMYTKEEVLERFSNMIRMIPGKSNTAIFPNWVSTNWAKNGKVVDTERNPLFRSVVAELAAYGLTLEKLNEWAKIKVCTKGGGGDGAVSVSSSPVHDNGNGGGGRRIEDEPKADKPDIDGMFERFWKEYPGPRKVDKKKCRDKFSSAVEKSAKGRTVDDAFNDIMEGLRRWKGCSTWNKDNGQFIRAPLVWLNNENWKDVPDSGAAPQDSNPSADAARAAEASIVENLRRKGLM